MTQQVELTQSEIEMVRIKREQDTLKQAQEKLEREAKEIKEIDKIKIQMRKEFETAVNLRAAAFEMFKKLKNLGGSEYTIKESLKKKEYSLSRWVGKSYEGATENGYIGYFKETQEIPKVEIYNGELCITPVIKWTNVGSGFYASQKANGIEFKIPYQIGNRNLSSAKTIHEKFQAYKQKIASNVKAYNTHKSGTEFLLERVKQLHPTTEVEKYEGGHYSGRTTWIEEKYVKAVFTSGLIILYNFSEKEGNFSEYISKINVDKMDKSKLVALLGC